MIAILHTLTTLAVLTVVVLGWFGLSPKTATGGVKVFYLAALSVTILSVLAVLWRLLFVDARRVEAAGIDAAAAPDRVFGYRLQKVQSGVVFALAGLLAAPALVVCPLLWVVGSKAAAHPAVIGGAAFVFLMGGVLFVVARRGWSARVALFPDRLAVRGIYSNGSLRWDEATAFLHEEVPAGEWNTMWVYYLCGETRSVRVEYSVESSDVFVRAVEARTGLRLEKRPLGWVPVPARRGHAAFRR